MGTEFQNDLGLDVIERRRSRRILKADYISVLLANCQSPIFSIAENLFAANPKNFDKFTADVLLTGGHHFRQNSRALGLRQSFPARIAVTREAKGDVIHGQIDVFRKAVDCVIDFRQRCATLEKQAISQGINRKQLFQRPADPEVLFNDSFGKVPSLRRFGEQVRAVAFRHSCNFVHAVSSAIRLATS